MAKGYQGNKERLDEISHFGKPSASGRALNANGARARIICGYSLHFLGLLLCAFSFILFRDGAKLLGLY